MCNSSPVRVLIALKISDPRVNTCGGGTTEPRVRFGSHAETTPELNHPDSLICHFCQSKPGRQLLGRARRHASYPYSERLQFAAPAITLVGADYGGFTTTTTTSI